MLKLKLDRRMKSVIQKTANRLGYEIRRLPNARGEECTGQPPVVGEYTFYYSWGRTYSPWWLANFQEIISKVVGSTLITPDRCYIIHRFCLNSLHLQGDFAECGVYKGGSAFLIANTIRHHIETRPLHLFDTFTGMPNTAVEGVDGHKVGEFSDASLDSVSHYLAEFPFVIFHAGFIPDTFIEVEDRLFSFVHVDVDIYRTASDCCGFFYPRLAKGGVMLFDDYGFPECKGLKQAVDEFFADKKESQIVLPTGQCFVTKL